MNTPYTNSDKPTDSSNMSRSLNSWLPNADTPISNEQCNDQTGRAQQQPERDDGAQNQHQRLEVERLDLAVGMLHRKTFDQHDHAEQKQNAAEHGREKAGPMRAADPMSYCCAQPAKNAPNAMNIKPDQKFF